MALRINVGSSHLVRSPSGGLDPLHLSLNSRLDECRRMASSSDETQFPDAPIMTGFGLSKQQAKDLVPFLDGFDAGHLADVIWDAIMCVGFDDVAEGFGVFFSDDGQTQGLGVSLGGAVGRNSVFYWDTQGTMKLPRKAFLQVMELIAVHTLTTPPASVAETGVDEEQVMKEEANRSRLRIALRALQKKLKDSTAPSHSSLTHQCSSDSGFQDIDNAGTFIQQAQCRWDRGRGGVRRSSLPAYMEGGVRRGLEGVLHGRPLPRMDRKGSLNERVLAKIAAVKYLTPKKKLSSVAESEPQPQDNVADILGRKLNIAEEGNVQEENAAMEPAVE